MRTRSGVETTGEAADLLVIDDLFLRKLPPNAGDELADVITRGTTNQILMGENSRTGAFDSSMAQRQANLRLHQLVAVARKMPQLLMYKIE